MDGYGELGYTSRIFGNPRTKFQLYHLDSVIQACNWDGYASAEYNGMVRALLDQLNTHPERRRELAENGVYVSVPVTYKLSGIGRHTCFIKGTKVRVSGRDDETDSFMTKGSGVYPLNYCCMKREAREHCAHRTYVDCDMVTCHPTIHLHLFKAAGLECPLLASYVSNRDTWRDEICESCCCKPEHAKPLMLSASNAGRVEAWCNKHGIPTGAVPQRVHEFRSEMIRNRNALLSLPRYKAVHEQAVREKRPEPERTAFSKISQDYERQCMEIFVIEAERDGFAVDAIIFDGWFLPKNIRVTPQHLARWSDVVYRFMGIRLHVSVKQMSEHPVMATLPTDLRDLCEVYPAAAEIESLDDDAVRPAAALFKPLKEYGLLDDLVCIGTTGSDWMVFNSRSGLWSACDVQRAASRIRFGVLERQSDMRRYFSVKEIVRLQDEQLPVKCLNCYKEQMFIKGFEESLDRIPQHCMAFDNGMLDARTGELRALTRDDRLTMTIGRDYLPKSEWTEQNHANLEKVNCVETQYFPDQARREFFERLGGLGIFGGTGTKGTAVFCDAPNHPGDSGKSTLLGLVRKAFGKYSAGDLQDFWTLNKNKGGSSHTAHLAHMRGKRLNASDETACDGTVIDIGLFKKLNDKSVSITCRGVSKDYVDVEYQCLNIMACNAGQFPREALLADPSCIKRLWPLQFHSRFLDSESEEYKCLKNSGDDLLFPKDDALMDEMKGFTQEWTEVFLRGYRQYLEIGLAVPQVVISDRELILGQNDELGDAVCKFVSEHVSTKAQPDVRGMSSEELRAYFDTIVTLADVLCEFKKYISGDSSLPRFDDKEVKNSLMVKLKSLPGVCIDPRYAKRLGDDRLNPRKTSEKKNAVLGIVLARVPDPEEVCE